MMSGSSFTALLLFVGLQCIYCTSENIMYEYLRIRRQNIDGGFSCKLPQHPNNGRWTLINGSARPGDEVSKNSILKFECDPGYKLSPNNSLLACDVNWTDNVPTCQKRCSAKYSTQTTTIKCENKLGHQIPCDEAVDGTYLTYSCIPFYETPLGYKKSILCVDGTWNFPNPVCQPACGKKIDKDTVQLLVGGTKNDKREYPWIVAVFQKRTNEYSNICGGTLISQRVVITAAHCVTNNDGDALSPTEFLVGAGKYYTKFQDPRDVGAQYIDVARIVVNPAYKGASQRFFADIALLITKDLVVFNEAIQPVCYQDLPSLHLQAGKIGVIAGWGATKTGEQPDELRTLEIPYKYETTCSQELPSDWADRYNTVDKICAGFINKTKSVCTGDSGSGLYFKNPDDNRYYIHGIVSIAPAEKGNCNFQQNALYTKVAFYYEFVDREATKQYVEQCTLPAYPCNGKWVVPNQNKKPGDIVPSNTILKLECNQGYELTTNSAFINCVSAYAMPKCELLCPKLKFPNRTKYNCSNMIGDEIDCSKAADGSTLTFTCPKGYISNNNKVRYCKQGSWGKQKPECLVEKIEQGAATTIIGEKKLICTYASWYAYDKVFPEDLDASLCTHIVYSFAIIGREGDVGPLDRSHESIYRKFTALKQNNKDLKILLSIGTTEGSDSVLFSAIAKDESKKSAFIRSAINIVTTYNFDGINIEWFYPKQDDKTNYINLLQDLKEKCNERGLLLSATVRAYPDEAGYDGEKMAEILDWVTIRSYGYYGPWSTYTGQNSPLFPSSVENPWEKDHLNIEASGKKWINLGVPKSKLILSIAFYGRSFTLSEDRGRGLHIPFKGAGVGNGFLRYSEFCTNSSWVSTWDDEQKSVISYYEDQWLGHENARSVRVKSAYAKENAFLGVNVWPIDGDDVYGKCGERQPLLKQVRSGLGKNIS